VDETGVLYFSSNGHTGMGGLDLFTAEKTDKGWGNIQNMKSPINTGADDFGICITQSAPANINDPSLKSGYFSSNRQGGKGDDDIYFFTYQNINTFEIILTVLEKDYADTSDPDSEILGTKLLSNVDVDVKQTKPKSGMGMDTTFEVGNGKLAFDAGEESSYSLFVSKDGYLNKSTSATTIGKKTTDSIHVQVYVEVELEKIWPDYSFEIPNIYYDYNEATLRPESFPVLDSLLSFFFENPDITIEIGSHTDSRGSKSYNEELSQARAQSVVDYLTSKEVNAERLIAKGYGESKLVNECSDGVECTEEQHQRNRRTTFRIVSDDEVIESSNPDDVRVDPKN
jgi:outer membrane protein OmpA-like peptidoglycan-associated protein